MARRNLIAALLVAAGAGLCFLFCGSVYGQQEREEDPSGFFKQWSEMKENRSRYRPTQPLLQLQKFEAAQFSKWKDANKSAPFTSCEFIGPHNVGGRTRALLIDGDTVFAGSVGGGLWVSKDRAGNWSPVAGNDQFPSMIVSCITQNPLDPNYIYFGTGEPFKESFYGGGIFRSVDRGETFEILPSTETDVRFIYSLCIAHDKRSPNTVYVGTMAPSHIRDRREFGLLRSSDNGNSWETVLGNRTVSDIVTFPDGSVLVACKGIGLCFSPTGSAGTFRPVGRQHYPAQFQLIRLAQCDSAPSTVYAAFEGPEPVDAAGRPLSSHVPVTHVLLTTDGARTWKLQSSLVSDSRTPGGPYISTTLNNYCFSLAVHPNESRRMVCGAASMYYSEDCGNTWTIASLSHLDTHSIDSFRDATDTFLVGTDGGVYQYDWSDLAGEAQARNEGLAVTQYYTGAVTCDLSVSLGGTRDTGTRRATDGHCYIGRDGGYCAIGSFSNRAWMSAQYMSGYDNLSSLFYCDDVAVGTPGPASEKALPEEMASENFAYVNPFIVNSLDDRQLFCRTNQAMWRSIDRGDHWERLTSGVISGIQTIDCGLSSQPTLFFGGKTPELVTPPPGYAENSFLFRVIRADTAHQGNEINLSNSIPGAIREDYLKTVRCHPSNANRLFVGFSNYSDAPRIWLVDNVLDTVDRIVWRDISGNLTGEWQASNAVNSFAVDPTAADSRMYVGTDRGLYYSVNGGRHWDKYLGIPNTMVMQLVMCEDGNSLFVFTHGRGVWRVAL